MCKVFSRWLVSVVRFLCLLQRSQSRGVFFFLAILKSLSRRRIWHLSSRLNHGLFMYLLVEVFNGIDALAAESTAQVPMVINFPRKLLSWDRVRTSVDILN